MKVMIAITQTQIAHCIACQNASRDFYALARRPHNNPHAVDRLQRHAAVQAALATERLIDIIDGRVS